MPLASAADGRLCGFEALVRWAHPQRGLIPPLDFIPLAEDSGLIGPLGEWVLRRACADAALWPQDIRVAVNLSPRQLHHAQLPDLVFGVLQSSGLAPERLELEITETALFASVRDLELRLNPQKASVEILLIDSVSRPSGN